MGFELLAVCLLGRCSMTSAIPPVKTWFLIETQQQRKLSHTICKKNCESPISWLRDWLCKIVTWWWIHQILQFRVITLSFSIYIHKSHCNSDTSLELFFKVRVEHKHLFGSWFQQVHVVHWDSSTSHYKFLLLVPIKLTPSVLRLNSVIKSREKVHVYWYIGTIIGMNFSNLIVKRRDCSEAIYTNNILL
jgi:hypothetical protein